MTDNNCYITTNDPVILIIYDKQKTIDTFGDDFLEEYGHNLPPELLSAYFGNLLEFERIQKELEKYKHGK